MKKSQELPNPFQRNLESYFDALLVANNQEIIQQVHRAACYFFAFAKARLIGLKIRALIPKLSKTNKDQKAVWFPKKDDCFLLSGLQLADFYTNKLSKRIIHTATSKSSPMNLWTLNSNKRELDHLNSSDFYNGIDSGITYKSKVILKTEYQSSRSAVVQIPTKKGPASMDVSKNLSKIKKVRPGHKTRAGGNKKTALLYHAAVYLKNITYQDFQKICLGISEQIKNINQKKKAEFELKKEKVARCSPLYHSSCIFLIINAQHKIEFANRKASDLFKTPYREFIGKDWFESYIPQRHRNRLSNLFDQIIKSEITSPREYKHAVLIDNTKRQIQWQNEVLKNHDTKLKLIVSEGIDVTIPTINPYASKGLGIQNDTLFYRFPHMMFIEDCDGNFLEFYGSEPHKLLVTKDIITEKGLKDILPATICELICHAQLRVYHNNQSERVAYKINEPNQTICYGARISSIYGGNLLSIIRDLKVDNPFEEGLKDPKEQLKVYAHSLEAKVKQRTETLMTALDQLLTSNLQLEEQIVETQEAKKRALVNKTLSMQIAKNFPNGFIIVFDSKIKIFLIEEQGIRKLKLDKVISEDMSVDELALFPERQKEKLKEQILKTIEGKHLQLEIEYSKKHFAINTKPLFNKNGIISSALFVYNDISVQKKTALKAQNALKKEQELSELKSRFISMASHEFRTPLTAILSSAILIEKLNASGKEDQRLRHVSKIRSSVKNLVVILNDFLSLSKLQEGKVSPELTEFNIIDFVKSVVEEIEIIKKDGQNIIMKHQSSSVEVFLEVQLWRHILFNLLSNAIKYSEKTKENSISICSVNPRSLLKVTDQGIGIPIEDQVHMFERFYRTHNAVNIEATGLGLNIVKQ
ncbi:PAS domain-containing sensor histidine kinase [Nonlabens sp.]|uniref:sensor histidine kinase n=1 Tax=Nonlabens sp. TaxID=1888209 RepID=UPI001BD01A3A|nr:PAS domain-containing sensor histidine kinase [Nonlabens sp.]